MLTPFSKMASFREIADILWNGSDARMNEATAPNHNARGQRVQRGQPAEPAGGRRLEDDVKVIEGILTNIWFFYVFAAYCAYWVWFVQFFGDYCALAYFALVVTKLSSVLAVSNRSALFSFISAFAVGCVLLHSLAKLCGMFWLMTHDQGERYIVLRDYLDTETKGWKMGYTHDSISNCIAWMPFHCVIGIVFVCLETLVLFIFTYLARVYRMLANH